MTIAQLIFFTGLAAILTAVAAVLTRATGRRIIGATAGAAACGPAMLVMLAVCESAGWWHFNMRWDAAFIILLWISIAACGYPLLLAWRIARRYGATGLLVMLAILAIIGPFRDSYYMRKFPEWGYYAPGLAPMLAVSAAYVILAVVGYGTMRLIAGPASADRLARRRWKHS